MLAGLNEEQATHRLSAIDAFMKLDVKVTQTAGAQVGRRGLKPFGYDLFKDSSSTFAPVTDVPVPSDYIVGARRPAQRAAVRQPEPQPAPGRRTRRPHQFSRARSHQRRRPHFRSRWRRTSNDACRAQMIGVRASVSMGDTRSIRVFVMGEANRPGSYTVSGLATITSALYAAGGIKPIGSLRDIQLKRQGAVVRRLDLYDLLLRGDTSDDTKLLPGDVIFIPPVSATVAVDGEVHRPAIYEIRGNTSVADIVQLAGGLTSEADTGRAALVRVNERRARVVVNVPLDAARGRSELLRNGDSLRMLRLRPTLDQGVTVEGHVFRPAPVAWHEGLRLTDVIGSVDELKPNADLNYMLIRRELPPDRRVVDAVGGSCAPRCAIRLRRRTSRSCRATGSSCSTSSPARSSCLSPLLEEMRRQSRIDQPSEIVRIDGRVKARGDYPLEPQMRVSDLLRAGGGLQDAAYGAKAELTRYRVERRRAPDATHRNRSGRRPERRRERRPAAAAIRFPQRQGSAGMERAGAGHAARRSALPGHLSDPARRDAALGARSRRRPHRAGISRAARYSRARNCRSASRSRSTGWPNACRATWPSTALQAAAANQGQAGQALTVGQSLLTQLKATKAVGRLVIDLNERAGSARGFAGDVVLRDGDRLIIPEAEAGSDGHRRSAEHHLAFLPRGPLARRLHRAERRRHPQGRSRPHLHRARRRQRGVEREQRLVPAQRPGGDEARRHHRRAARHRAHAGAAAVAGGHAASSTTLAIAGRGGTVSSSQAQASWFDLG